MLRFTPHPPPPPNSLNTVHLQIPRPEDVTSRLLHSFVPLPADPFGILYLPHPHPSGDIRVDCQELICILQ